ncbi:MAG: DUF2059 domain-containing protein [Desulfosarcinaceae bacterium]|jgi:hypothetical protein
MKKTITVLILSAILSIILAANALAASEISKEKKALIDTLLAQTGQSAIAIGKQFSNLFIQQMTAILEKSKPDIDPKAFDILEEEINAVIHEEIVVNGALSEMMYPIYDKHFTNAELKKMIELNKTEFGKKMIRVMPLITQESMQAGQQFGQGLGPKIKKRLTDRFREEGITN